METLMRNLTEIVLAIIGVGMLALLLNKNANTVGVVQTSGSVLDNLLKTVTLQNGSYGGIGRY